MDEGECSVCKAGPRIKTMDWVSNFVISDDGADFLVDEDGRDNKCGERMRGSPASFGIHPVVTSQEFVDQFNGATHIVFNEFAHVATIIMKMEECYNDVDKAVRKVLQWWRVQMIIKAALFAKTRARVFYRLSPPAGDFVIWPGHPQTSPLNIEDLRSGGNQGGSVIRLAYRATRDDMYGSQDEEAVARAAFSRVGEYFHELVNDMNAMGKEEFRAAGHGVVVDIDDMIGLRQDGHPASLTGLGDMLHYCMPGVPDFALEATLVQVLR